MPFADSNGRQPHRTFAYLTRTSLFTPKRAYPVTPAAIAEGVEVLRSLIEFDADFHEIARDRCEDDASDLCGYCTVDLPLDLPDSVIIGPVEHFEAARAKLDENGWSGDVMVHPVSRLRAILLLSIIREEVLELSLGPSMPNIAQQAR